MARLARFIGFRGLALSIVLCITLISSSSVANAGTIVQFDTSLGSFNVELYDTATPITVQNFLSYVNSGRYNGPFMHRKVMDPGLEIIQGGGFVYGVPSPLPVAAFPSIVNEFDPSRSNVRGTIAMAKSSDPDSATSQFFFNLGDNSTALDNPANSGGFTVFGEVIGNGMDVLDAMGALETFNFGGVFATLPLRDYTQDDYQNEDLPTPDTLVSFNVSVTPEPASLSLLGLSGLVMLKRRRKNPSGLRRRKK